MRTGVRVALAALVVAWLMTGLLVLTGCPAVTGPACTVIDLAHGLCTIIRVPGPDGGTVEVRVPREELEGLARSEMTRQAAVRADGGAE